MLKEIKKIFKAFLPLESKQYDLKNLLTQRYLNENFFTNIRMHLVFVTLDTIDVLYLIHSNLCANKILI